MWQPTIPTVHQGRALTGAEAWIHTFAKAWEELEHDPEDLNMGAFGAFGTAVLAKYGDESPAAVAARLYPDAGEYRFDLYPAYRPEPEEAPAAPKADWLRVTDEDVPF
ncbi:hypothetical protein BH10PSE18_BH10PSE18_04610 [soil metagenome]